MKSIAVCLGFTFVMLFLGCADGKSPERLFAESLNDTVATVEKEGKSAALSAILDPEFEDQAGRSPAELMQWIDSLLKKHPQVVVNILDIDVKTEPLAGMDGELDIDLTVSSGSLRLIRKLIGFYGRLVRLQLNVTDGEPWRIRYAEWQEIDLADLSVRALDEFKKLFPGSGV